MLYKLFSFNMNSVILHDIIIINFYVDRKPTLTPNAVPRLFDGVLSYLSTPHQKHGQALQKVADWLTKDSNKNGWMLTVQ